MSLLNFWLKTNNNMVQKTLLKVANNIADWASKVYPVLKAQHPDASEEDVFLMMLKQEVTLRSGSAERIRGNVCSSIESLCYFMGTTAGPLKDWDNFRTLQFTQHMDAALYARGFKRQSATMRRQALLNRGYPLEHVDQFLAGR